MNNQRRKSLEEIISKLNSLYSNMYDIRKLIKEVLSEEERAIYNVPENLQDTECYEAMQYALDSLGEADNEMDYALEHISSTEDLLQEVIDG